MRQVERECQNGGRGLAARQAPPSVIGQDYACPKSSLSFNSTFSA